MTVVIGPMVIMRRRARFKRPAEESPDNYKSTRDRQRPGPIDHAVRDRRQTKCSDEGPERG